MALQQEDRVCAQVIVRGRVQGVFFRAETADVACQRGLGGWVRNLPDGGVEAVLQGKKTEVDAVIAWCRQGPPSARVDSVEISWREVDEALTDFKIC